MNCVFAFNITINQSLYKQTQTYTCGQLESNELCSIYVYIFLISACSHCHHHHSQHFHRTFAIIQSSLARIKRECGVMGLFF